MKPGSNSANRTILIVIFSCLAFCCVGGGLLALFGYQSGTAAAKEDGKFIETAFRTLSDEGYVFKDSQKYFAPVGSEIKQKQNQIVLDAIREKLGKFVSIGDVKGFYMKTGTGGSSHRVTYEIKFEKGDGTLQAVITNPGTPDQKIYSWYIGSSVFEKAKPTK